MYNRLLQPDLLMMLQENDTAGLREFCDALYPAVLAEVLLGLDSKTAWAVLATADIERQAEIFEFLDPQQQMELVADVDRKHLSKLIETMSPDDRVDLLERMDEEQVENVLPLVARAERSDIRKLLSYHENSAGSIMTTEYASLPEDITVAEALERLRRQAPDSETIYYVFVIDEGRRLHGIISLRELILARPAARLADLMTRDVISVRADDDKEEVAHELARYDLIALPVVDNQNRLVGIITHDDVLDVLQDEAEEDAYRQSAIEPLEDSYLSTPLAIMAWKRGVWLLVLSAVALGTATILNRYSGISGDYNWLVWFLPLVLASGGNTGSQSATLVIRALAITSMNRTDQLKMARRELLAGLTLGTCLGLFAFCAAQFLFGRTVSESAVVGATVGLVVTMGTLTGSLLPLIFKTLGMDPALMSNPLIASLSDILGVVIYYNVALLVLS